ncbi:MAG: hypothetical protein HZB66_03435 [Candidatus Aenigmarchaeota archaeon]|nr:hypothetical protein [Candidatus Aenigmarchaeota archaeon]
MQDAKYHGERSSSFILFGDKLDRGILTHNAAGLAYTRNGVIVLGGERVGEVYVPDSNWILEFDFEQGWVTKTGPFEEATEIWGDDASYFSANRSGLRNASRFHNWDHWYRHYPFSVYVQDGPEDGGDDVGVRLASRPEPVRSTGDAAESDISIESF